VLVASLPYIPLPKQVALRGFSRALTNSRARGMDAANDVELCRAFKSHEEVSNHLEFGDGTLTYIPATTTQAEEIISGELIERQKVLTKAFFHFIDNSRTQHHTLATVTLHTTLVYGAAGFHPPPTSRI
jgi:hypothetical protein